MWCLVSGSSVASAQLSFQSTLSLAMRESVRAKMAQDDVARVTAVLAENRDYYIPSFGVGGGLGRSYGISLIVPTIFTINTQSLLYSASQKNYIRGARESLASARYALEDVRQQVEEDAALTYISLDEALSRKKFLTEERVLASRLVNITEQRASAGVDSPLELKKVRRTLIQIRLQEPQVDNDIAVLQEHLSQLTGLGKEALLPISSSIPEGSSIPKLAVTGAGLPDTPGILASEANARAKAQQALGDRRYTFRPQVSMQSQYGRISPINNVSEYYNLNGHYNTMFFGVAIQLPLLDKVHSAKARETAAEALHAQHEAELLRNQQNETQLRLSNSLSELEARVELAELDRDISEEELQATLKEVKSQSGSITGGRQLNPKDEIYAQLAERQHQIDWLEATLQLRRAQISWMRQNGQLDGWVRNSSYKNALPALPEGTPASGPPTGLP